jgi:hypothetical protein
MMYDVRIIQQLLGDEVMAASKQHKHANKDHQSNRDGRKAKHALKQRAEKRETRYNQE